MHMEFKDLSPRMQKQVLKQIAMENREPANRLAKAARGARSIGKEFDSRGEYEYYIGTVMPKMKSGEIVECEQHPRFALFGAGNYCGIKLGAIRYTADFKNTYKDGTVEIVEIKSKFVRRMQRDYPLRRRIFLEKYAIPEGWRFTEIITDDTKEDINGWQNMTKEGR